VISVFDGDVAFTLALAEYDKTPETQKTVTIFYKGKKHEWEDG